MRVSAAFLLIACTCLIAAPPASADSLQLKREEGVFVLPVQVNNAITLKFTIDSGASDVVIPLDVFSTLSRAGTITSKDMLDSQTYELADGSYEKARKFRIRSLKIGNLELHDVVGSVAPTGGTPLLGQSFLSHLPSWSIDNRHDLLVVGEATTAGRSGNDTANSPIHGTRSPATVEPTGPRWVLVGSYPEQGLPNQIFQFIDAGRIRELGPGVRAAWVKVAYWFNFRYEHCGDQVGGFPCPGPMLRDFDTRPMDSDVQHAITSVEPIEGGLFLAEFNCSTGLGKSLNSDKWEGVEAGSINAVEEQLVCGGRERTRGP
jgi:clan AA aspartic protease (TIGR02281 family)